MFKNRKKGYNAGRIFTIFCSCKHTPFKAAKSRACWSNGQQLTLYNKGCDSRMWDAAEPVRGKCRYRKWKGTYFCLTVMKRKKKYIKNQDSVFVFVFNQAVLLKFPINLHFLKLRYNLWLEVMLALLSVPKDVAVSAETWSQSLANLCHIFWLSLLLKIQQMEMKQQWVAIRLMIKLKSSIDKHCCEFMCSIQPRSFKRKDVSGYAASYWEAQVEWFLVSTAQSFS